MTKTKFKQAQKRLGLSNSQAAKFFKVSHRTIYNWCSGLFPVSAAAAEKMK